MIVFRTWTEINEARLRSCGSAHNLCKAHFHFRRVQVWAMAGLGH